MIHTFKINGMTFNGCRSHVENPPKVEGVISAQVDLQKAEAVIGMEEHIPLEKLQSALQKDGGAYGISHLELLLLLPHQSRVRKAREMGYFIVLCDVREI